MAHYIQLKDRQYRNWVKAGLGLKYLKEGIETFIDDEIKSLKDTFLSDIRNYSTCRFTTCDQCSIRNVLPCSTYGICNVAMRSGICNYHDKNDDSKKFRNCPNNVCDKIKLKIEIQHRFHCPSWKNTDPKLWCTNHWEIAKCFLPVAGYDKKSCASETDCSGLLNIVVNCLVIGNKLDDLIHHPRDIVSKNIKARNDILHSSNLQLTDKEMTDYIDGMIKLLQDKKTLAADPNAQAAVVKLTQLKEDKLVISTKDEDEIREAALAAIEEKKNEAIEAITNKQAEVIEDIRCRNDEQNIKQEQLKLRQDELEEKIEEVQPKLDVIENLDGRSIGYLRRIQEQHTWLIDMWKKDEHNYVETRASKFIYTDFLKGNFITITGNSGSGKTAIANHIAIKLLQQNSHYEVIPVDNLKEIKDYLNRSRRQVFVLNDVLGKTVIDSTKLTDLESYNETIESLVKDTNIKLMFTIRKQLIKDPSLKRTIVCKNVIDLHDVKHKLTQEEQICILKTHTSNKASEILDDINAITEVEYSNFPLLCKLFGANKHFQAKKDAFFRDMFVILVSELEDIKHKQPVQFCALVLCMLHENSFNSVILEPFSACEASSKERVRSIMEACEVPQNTAFTSIKSHMEILVDVYLVQEGKSFRFIHDTLYEAIAYLFGINYPLELLKHCSSSFVRERIRIHNTSHTDKDTADKYLFVVIKPEHYPNMAERLSLEIERGNFHDVFLNPIIHDEEFQKCFCQYLANISKETLGYMFLYKTPNTEQFDRFFHQKKIVWDKNWFLLRLMKVRNVKAIHWILAHNIHLLFRYVYPLLKEYLRNADTPLSLIPMACLGGNIDAFTMLLNDGNHGTLNDTWEERGGGMSVLHMAALSGNSDMITLIVNKGINVDITGNGNGTPLLFSAALGLTNICQTLVNYNCDSSISDGNGSTPMMIASQEGHYEVVKLLLQHSASVNKSNKDGVTPLIRASGNGHLEVVKLLLQHSASVNKSNKDGVTPLIRASGNGHLEVVKLLLQHSASVNKSNKDGVTPLIRASWNGHLEVVKLLLQHSADVNMCQHDGISPLWMASQKGTTDVVRVLLEHGADVNLCWGDTGASPVYQASRNGHLEVVKLLLQHSASVNKSNKDGVTPLIRASGNGHLEVVKLLLQHSASVNKSNKDGVTPLIRASWNGHLEVVKLLLQHSADVNMCQHDGISPLWMASQKGTTDVVRVLLEHGADVNLCWGDTGASPVYQASQNGRLEVVKLLLQHSASVNKSNKDGVTPLIRASGNGLFEVVKLLLQYSASVNKSNKDGVTPLIRASGNGHLEVVKLLLQHSAEVNMCQHDGVSPLWMASQTGTTDVVRVLLEHGADVNLCMGDTGASPVYQASRNGHLEVVKLLLQHSASVNKSNKDGVTPLIRASGNGHLEVVKLLLQHSADVNMCQHDGVSPLWMASQTGTTDVVRVLLEHGADVKFCWGDTGASPVYQASRNGHLEVVKLLLQHSASVNKSNKDGVTPLIRASGNGHLEVVKLLLQHSASVNKSNKDGVTPLIRASGNGHLEVVKLLLQHSADVNMCQHDGSSTVYAAASIGHTEMVTLLLQHGADGNICERNCKQSPLFIASEFGHPSVVNVLLEHGVDIDLSNIDNDTPLFISSFKGKAEVVNLLLRYKANIRIVNKYGLTAADAARRAEHRNIVQLLSEPGSDKHGCDNLLSAACIRGNIDGVRYLLDSGIDINLPDDVGQPPLSVASSYGEVDAVKLLLERGADVNCCNNIGNTAIIEAAITGNKEIVELLLQHHADINRVNKHGRSAADASFMYMHRDIGSLLPKGKMEKVMTLRAIIGQFFRNPQKC